MKRRLGAFVRYVLSQVDARPRLRVAIVRALDRTPRLKRGLKRALARAGMRFAVARPSPRSRDRLSARAARVLDDLERERAKQATASPGK